MELALILLAGLALALAVLLLRAERRAAAAEAGRTAAERRFGDFQELRQQSLTEARAAVLDTAQTLSSKLLEDHRRETESARKDAEERARQSAEGLVKQVDAIAKAVQGLDREVQEKGRMLDTVWRSLSSPGGAGQTAEIGLANTLNGFGLEAPRDYVLQMTLADDLDDRRLRPDAVVFLPGNSALIIDSKASKFLIEIAAAADAEAEKAAYLGFADTMNKHLHALAEKNYRTAFQAAWRKDGKPELARLWSVMYVPNDGALEKLCRADPGFAGKAHAAEIIPAGPSALRAFLSVAAAEIVSQRQIENHQRIVAATEALLESLGKALEHVAGVGKGIRGAADAFAKLTGSLNQRLLPRARRLGAFGLSRGKALPGNLPAYAVTSLESDQLIEGEASEVEGELPPPAGPRLVS